MCIFITAVLPPDAATDELQAVARKHGASFVQLENPFVRNQLLPGETYYRATDRHCDCGTLLASRVKIAGKSTRAEVEAQASKLRKRGWSEAKIERWLVQHQQAEAARADRRSHALEGEPDWLSLLAEVRERRLSSYLGLLVHSYEGSPADENVTIADRELLKDVSLTDERLGRMSRDRLYAIDLR